MFEDLMGNLRYGASLNEFGSNTALHWRFNLLGLYGKFIDATTPLLID
jgi:hypothetical protein